MRPALDSCAILHAAGDHQTFNARVLEAAGAAVCIPQLQLSPERLAATIIQCASSEQALKQMASAAHQMGKPEALQQTVELVEQMMSPVALKRA